MITRCPTCHKFTEQANNVGQCSECIGKPLNYGIPLLDNSKEVKNGGIACFHKPEERQGE